jgi:hypothetical protein
MRLIESKIEAYNKTEQVTNASKFIHVLALDTLNAIESSA